jgi:hypothetical protein
MTEKHQAHLGQLAAKRVENLKSLDEMPRSALVNAEQAAAFLGVSPGTMSVWRSTGRVKLNFVKVGGRAVRYSCGDLQDFIAAGTHAHSDKKVAG